MRYLNKGTHSVVYFLAVQARYSAVPSRERALSTLHTTSLECVLELPYVFFTSMCCGLLLIYEDVQLCVRGCLCVVCVCVCVFVVGWVVLWSTPPTPTRPVVWSPPSLITLPHSLFPSPPLVLAQSRQRLWAADGWLPRQTAPDCRRANLFSRQLEVGATRLF